MFSTGVAVVYRYELRGGDEVVATGLVTRERPLAPGDWTDLGGLSGVVRSVEPILGEAEVRLVVQLVRDSGQ